MADKLRHFSDAILLGATFKPQCFGSLIGKGRDESCALQAAAEAIGLNNGHNAYIDGHFYRRWPKTTEMIQCPLCITRTDAVSISMHLNDAHYWKRECIAAFLKTKGL